MSIPAYKCSRVEQIINLDTKAHLTTIRDLEARLTEYHRRDQIPTWAESLIRRVEVLESITSKAHYESEAESLPIRNLAVPMCSPRPAEATIFDLMLDRLRSHFDSRMISNRLYLDSRVEMITFELDRLHNLLTIRPTTADFQLVVASLNDVHRKMYDSLDDIAAGIGSTVQGKVATEMNLFMQQLSTNERSNTKRIQVALDKTDRISKSILELSEVCSAAIDDVISEAEETKTEITNLRKEMLAEIERSILELREAMLMNQGAAQLTINELHQRCADGRFLAISDSIRDANCAIELLESELIFDPNKIQSYSKSARGTINQALASIMQKLGGSFEKVENSTQIFPLLDKHSEALRVTETLLNDVEDKVAAVSALQSQFQLQEAALMCRIDALQKEEEDVKISNSVIRQAQVHITNLNSSFLEQNIATAQIEGLIKKAEVDIINLTAISGEHEATLAAIRRNATSSESRLLGLIEAMKIVCLNFITEKHEELVKQCIFL